MSMKRILAILLLLVPSVVIAEQQAQPIIHLLKGNVQLEQDQQVLQRQILELNKQILLQLQLIEAKEHTKDIKWIKAKNGNVPKNAVIGGYAFAQPLYICHASHMNSIHPGEVVKKGCLISYAGRSYIKQSYEVLVSKRKFAWDAPEKLLLFSATYPPDQPPSVTEPQRPVWSFDNIQLMLPIIGGHERDRPLYICRGIYKNRIHLGKTVARNCNISWQAAEIKLPVYEVLFLAAN